MRTPPPPPDPDVARLDEFRAYRPTKIFDQAGRLDMMTSGPIRSGVAKVERLGQIRKHWDLARVTIPDLNATAAARYAREIGLLARVENSHLVLVGPLESDDDDE